MGKFTLFAFNTESMCFIHVLLNTLDLYGKGNEVKVIIEGAACRLIPDMVREGSPIFRLVEKARSLNLIEGGCKAYPNRMGSPDTARGHGFRLLDEMSGHPAMATCIESGFGVLTF